MRHTEAREGETYQDENRRGDQPPQEQFGAQSPADQVATPPVGVAFAAPAEAAPIQPAPAQPGPAEDADADTAYVPAPAAVPPRQPEEDDDSGAVLFGAEDAQRFRARWRELQADFVDDPKQAVQGADDLVGEVMRALTEIVADHKRQLEGEWRDGAGETEELRVALRRYRAFLDQLLTTKV